MGETRERGGTAAVAARALTVFLVAAGALVLEIVAVRLIAPYVGATLYTWTAVIAVVLAGLSAGHLVGGLLAGRTDVLDLRLAGALAVAAVSTLAVPVLLRALAPRLLGGDLELPLQVALLSLALFAVPSAAAGAVSPIATRAALSAAPARAGRVLGAMFAAGALGSILGTLAGGLLFVPLLGSTRSVLLVAGLFALLALAHLLRRPRAALALAAVLPLAALPLWAWGRALRAFESPCEVESAYYCIRTPDFTHLTGRPSRALVLDHLVHGINDRDDPRLLYSPYLVLVERTLRAALGEDPPAVYHLGGGAYTWPRALAGRARLQVVAEIDPAVTRIAVERLWYRPDPATTVLHEDGRRALARLDPALRFDLILVDAFRDVDVPFHLVTREAFALVAQRLTPRGFVALNIVDRRREPRFLAALIRTLHEVFPRVEAWLEIDQARMAEGRVTWVVFAGRTLPFAAPLVDARAESGYAFVRLYPDRMDLPADVPVLTDDHAPVEHLLADVLRRPELAE